MCDSTSISIMEHREASEGSYYGLLGHYIMCYQHFFVFMQAVIPLKFRAPIYYTIQFPNPEDLALIFTTMKMSHPKHSKMFIA